LFSGLSFWTQVHLVTAGLLNKLASQKLWCPLCLCLSPPESLLLVAKQADIFRGKLKILMYLQSVIFSAKTLWAKLSMPRSVPVCDPSLLNLCSITLSLHAQKCVHHLSSLNCDLLQGIGLSPLSYFLAILTLVSHSPRFEPTAFGYTTTTK
jgi:hypothetical protein